ncbi:hypothetical protein Leryth_023052 [Lithospermum erythrorhizon]|nr:hypothetical protein Leryth_023052 [Lithospermum erythrorhizon]
MQGVEAENKSLPNFFEVTLTPSYINKGYLIVPSNFAKLLVPHYSTWFIKIEDANNNEWAVRFIHKPGNHILMKGWRHFVLEKKLMVGDIFRFERVRGDEVKMKVNDLYVLSKLFYLDAWFKESGVSSDGKVVDGSNIIKLVENEEVFGKFVHDKFKDLDINCDGKLSVKELEPAIDDIGAVLGLRPQGSSPLSDHIYSEVLNEFTHGTQQEVSKTKFKEVFSDFMVGVADGLKRNPVVILRIDGADLLTFIKSPSFEPEMLSIFSEIDHPDGSLREFLTKALGKLRVEQGMPPTSDIWVMSNVIEPAIQSCGGVPHQPVSQEVFLAEFKRVAERLARHLREEPVIVAHSESTYDGSGIKRLLSNKFEFDKTMESVISGFPKDRNGRISMAYYRVALDTIGPSASLPPVGAVDQIDRITTDALKMLDADKDKMVEKDEFKKVVAEILGSIMLQLEGNPISVSTNSVVHESDSSSSKLFQASST